MSLKNCKFLLCSGLSFLLFACAQQPTNNPPLPEGIQEVSGYLIPAELSLVRRGTHLLLNKGIQQYFVESRVTSLQAFEEKEVMIRGALEQNIDATQLPVLLVEEIREQEAAWKKVDIGTLDISLDIPPEWVMTRLPQNVLLTAPSSPQPTIRIVWEETTSIPTGEPVRIGGRSGVRVVNEETGEQKITVLYNTYLISIQFTPNMPDRLLEERAVFLRLLHSFKWDKARSTSQSSLSKDYGAPCGGSAGVLCPEGFYCEIADFKEGIGRCVKLQ